MNKEQLNLKLKEVIKQAGAGVQKTKGNLGKVFGKENVRSGFKKAKSGIDKAVDATMNSNLIKKMNAEQKLAVIGISAFIVIVIIALIGRLFFTPETSIWCVADAPKTELAFGSAGEVIDVAYSEKQSIPIGSTIARLNNEAYIADFESANSKLMVANLKFLNMENRLADMENALAESKLKSAESEFEVAKSAFELARAYERQYISHFENHSISEAQYLASVAAVANAEAVMGRAENALQDAQQNLEAAQRGYAPEEIASAKDEVEALTEQVERARKLVAGSSIISPFNAYINSLNIKVGDVVEPGKPVCELIDLNKISLRGLVDKSTAGSVKLGAAVNIEFSAIPNETFTGKILSVSSQPVEQKDGQDMYELRIEFNNPGVNIMPEMEAVAIVQ
ncbi:MAG: efflux RND transporter periplasmic adaptor subunit [Synergistaceae bacterium]|nr:efflux RND transporter periplasmic adaptor subunit [Synergistaceae bacterium]